VDGHTEQQARGIDRDVALAPLDLLGRVVAARPPFSVVFTLWVSTMVALGLGSLPSRSRSIITRWWRMLSHTPALVKARMYSYTVRQGGKAGGGGRWRHWQPVRTK
jgi:hypothetical protein